MLSAEDLVRRCAFAAAVVTGVDPYVRRNEVKGDDALQIARKLWVQFVAAEFGMTNSDAARMLARNRETIIINLAEIEDWRDAELHPRAGALLDCAIETMGEAMRSLLQSGLEAARSVPTPIERSRMNRSRAQRGA